MSILSKFLNFIYPLQDKGSNEASSLKGVGDDFYTYSFTSNGLPGNYWTYLYVSTVMQCITVLSNGISQVPFNILRKQDRNVLPPKEHPLYKLFTYAPNRWMSVFDFWQMVSLQLVFKGEVVIWKVKALGRIVELIPFGTDSFTIETYYEGGWAKRRYALQKDDGSTIVVPEDDVWHLNLRRMFLRDGLSQNVVAQKAVDIAMNEMVYTEKNLQNGAKPAGILVAKQQLNKEQVELIQQEWNRRNAGVNNTGNIVILSSEFDFKSMSFSNADSQFIENRKFQVSEICRMWNVNPYMVYHYDNNQSYNSNEQNMIAHITHTLAPLYRLIEKSAEKNLLTREEVIDKGIYFKFNEKALLRMDAKTQAEVFRTKIGAGMYTINESRELEDRPPVDGGDEPIVQGAMIKLTDVGKAYDNVGNNINGEVSPSPDTNSGDE